MENQESEFIEDGDTILDDGWRWQWTTGRSDADVLMSFGSGT